MRYILIFVFIGICSFAKAQTRGSLVITMDPKVEQLVAKRNEYKKAKGTMQGYRVQIYFGSSRTEASDVKTKFAALHPELESYLLYQQPYFKVRAGDFRSRFEAYKLYQAIQKEFSSVFIVKDEVKFPKLAN